LDLIKRIPGIGIQSAQKIVEARKFRKLSWDHLKKLNIAASRAQYFIQMKIDRFSQKEYTPQQVRRFIVKASKSKYAINHTPQLNLF
jgi:predicted DNA-binding helix-hairpin-helix protein